MNSDVIIKSTGSNLFFLFNKCSFRLYLSNKDKRVVENVDQLRVRICSIFYTLNKVLKGRIRVRLHPYLCKKNSKQQHVRPADQWKTFPDMSKRADFSYKKPEVDFRGMVMREEEKLLVEKRCKEKVREAVQVVESSVVDAATKLIRSREVYLKTVDKFSRRCLDVYEAYTEVMIDNNEPCFPLDVGRVKKDGYTHEDIKNFLSVTRTYISQKNSFKESLEKLMKIKSGEERRCLAEEVAAHLADVNFDTKACFETAGMSKEAVELLKNKKVVAAVKKYCTLVKKDKKAFKSLKNLEGKSIRFGATREELEKLKEDIAAFNPDAGDAFGVKKDKKYRLLQEIAQRCYGGDEEPGSVGSPLRLLNVLKGKYNYEDPDIIYRLKLYFVYKSKAMINEVLSNPKLMEQINKKLKEKKGWSLDQGIVDALLKRSQETPIFKFGEYAAENWRGKLRNRVPFSEQVRRKQEDPNPSFSEAEYLAKHRKSSKEVSEQDLQRRFRYRISEAEKMAFLGSNSELDRREHISVSKQVKEGKEAREKSDTGAYETVLDYQMRTRRLPWEAGKHFWNFHGKPKCSSKYLDSIEELGMPQRAGISGSTDQIFTMAGPLGIKSLEELQRLRLVFLPWMAGAEDHSVNEIMTAAKSFGLPYTPAADYYKQVLPGDRRFIREVRNTQRERGYQLPEYYLSNRYARKVLKEVRAENRASSLKEIKQVKEVSELQRNHKVFMKALVASKRKGNQKDLFCDAGWEWFLKKLDAKRKPSKETIEAQKNGKTKYVYNPEKDALEAHVKKGTYKGTKKTEVSLLPAHGKINPYGHDQKGKEVAGLLFNADNSEYQDRYIFKKDALTCNKWWRKFYSEKEIQAPDFQKRLKSDIEKIKSRKGQGSEESRNYLRAGSMRDLIKELEVSEKQNSFVDYNEILASVKKKGLLGIFCYLKKGENSDYSRFYALSKNLYIKEKLGIELPLFVIDSINEEGMRAYTKEEQLADIRRVLRNENKELDALVAYLSKKISGKNKKADLKASLIAKLNAMRL